ncbi:hypothetical protein ASF41_12720 [Methylobacterium sp. Leaf111]|uniref:flagellar hook-length control protein FliK n=1 Tax=Methylobacterium sp. Leaf111 TaxID=1736257 RepID=UPI0006F31D33|nr:flagellar hook-length control protein FliK [Methylobacterium sp. Leaf111]KQP51055.1 hypothetical protein ASF41_12720 [Methylobacterium sp. Leaf111]
MNTLGATSPGPRALSDAPGPRGAGSETPEAPRDAFGAVLGALGGGRNADETPTPEADRPGRRRDDEAAPAPSGEETDPLALLALVVPTAALAAGAPAPKPQAITLETLVARALPAQAPGQAVASGPATRPGGPDGPAGTDPLAGADLLPGADLLAGTDPVAAGRVPQAAGAEARTRIAVLQRETHFAPVLPSLLGGSRAAVPAPGAPGLPDAAALLPAAAGGLPAAAEGLAAAAGGLAAAAGGLAPGEAAAAVGPTPAAPPTGPANLPASGAPVLPAQPPTQAALVSATAAAAPARAPGSLSGDAGMPARDPVRGGAGPGGTERPPATPSAILRVDPVAASAETGTAAARAARSSLAPALPGVADANLSTPLTLPAGSLSGPAAAPAQQVAAAILAELPRGPAGAVPGALPGAPTGEGPLKLLTLQLHPADLGTVLVRMRLRDGQLEMSLQASREDSARLLREGGEVLNDLLRQGGYRPESVTVTVASPPADGRGASGNPGSQQGQGAQGAQGFPGQGESGANQGRPTPDQAGRRSSPGGDPAASDLHERMHESVSSSPDRSGVYL